MNSNAHFEHVRHKYLIKLISWVAVYTGYQGQNPLPANNFKKYKQKSTPNNKDILQTQDIIYSNNLFKSFPENVCREAYNKQ